MDICLEVEKLIEYSMKNDFVEEEDKILVTNFVLEKIGLDSYREFSENELSEIKREIEMVEYPTEILDNIVEWAAENGKVENTVIFKDLLNSGIMGQILPRTSEIRKKFWEKYAENIENATNYFYELSKKSNYIRTDRIAKNIHWGYESKYGKLDITINLSKPEKDPKEIAMARNKTSSTYPKGLLSKENEGYMGRINHPGRQNHRIIKLDLTGKEWYFQYSPYTYYNEHSIIFSGVERPMKIDRSGFERLLEFVEKFPHYFIGSNADLPIVGGSILSHDHFQGGRHQFPMEKTKILGKIEFSGYENVESGIVDWPMSVIRIRGDRGDLLNLSEKILDKWIEYSDENLDIVAYTDNERHNTITPIVRYRDGKYEMDLVLRNNRTNEDYPLGIFHPHSEYHNIKKENIGLIEVMGLAILPGRLKEEMGEIKEILLESKGQNSLEGIFEKMGKREELVKHIQWLKMYLDEDSSLENIENVDKFIENIIGDTFSRVLEDCGVFKNTEAGMEGFRKFIEFVNK